MDAPNILCFVTDQQRADHLACYGNPDLRTPNIDRLAREGVVFTESYVANPVCMPNRASMFTGRYPKAHRLRENGVTLPPGTVTLPGALLKHGYQTASFGKIHLAPFGHPEGMDHEEHELVESRRYWDGGGELPLPYHGLEHVYFVGGHVDYVFGHYRRELESEHHGAIDGLLKENALRPPTGAWYSWKASIPAQLHYNTLIADKTIEYLNARDREKPFFVWCSFPDPHFPFVAPAPYCDRYDPREIRFDPARREGELDDLPPHFRACYEGMDNRSGFDAPVRELTDAHYREMTAHTYGMISHVDECVGRVVGALEQAGDLENTVVLFFSDHADLLGDHWLVFKGPYLFRSLVRVPTIVRLPRAPKAGLRSSALISTVDLMPTLLEAAGVPIPEGVQGRSYRRVLSGEADEHREWVYVEFDDTALGDRLRQIRSRDWALTYQAQADHGLLFDLRKDPDELHNLWYRPECRSTRQDLLSHLLRQSSQADDWLPRKKTHA